MAHSASLLDQGQYGTSSLGPDGLRDLSTGAGARSDGEAYSAQPQTLASALADPDGRNESFSCSLIDPTVVNGRLVQASEAGQQVHYTSGCVASILCANRSFLRLAMSLEVSGLFLVPGATSSYAPLSSATSGCCRSVAFT